jgi:cell division transport system permease protein
MKKRPLVFSFVKEQAIFLTALIALLTFLATLAFGVVIGIGAGVAKWNSRWDTFATVQVLPGGDFDAATKLAKTAKRMTVVPDADVAKMLGPWLGNSSALNTYLPKIIEVEFAKESDLTAFGKDAANLPNVRFVPHSAGVRNITRAGWQIMIISSLVLLLVLGAIGLCISYITRNITLIHKRELSILTQIGASDSFVARQTQIIITKISALAALIGVSVGAPMAWMITRVAQGTKIGLMAQMNIPMWGWGCIVLLAIGIVIFTAYLARRTTLNILGS